MLSAQPLHAIVQGLCEKVGRHDAAPHGRGTEPPNSGAARGGGGQKNPPSFCYCTPTTGGPSTAKTMATFHTDEGFVAAINAASQTGQGEMLATHATPRLGGGSWKTSDTMQ